MKKWIIPKTKRQKEEPKEESMAIHQTFRIRADVPRSELSKLEEAWAIEDTALSFSDWCYVKHDIFLYIPNVDMSTNIYRYKNSTFSDRNTATYQPFVGWLEVYEGITFYDINSGRTSGEICKLLKAYEDSMKKAPVVEVEVQEISDRHDDFPLVCDVRPRFTFKRMEVSSLDNRIKTLKERLEREGESKPLLLQLSMAERYRIRLIEEGQ